VLAGVDFFTVEVLTWRGLVTYYVVFFIHLESRRVCLAGVTRHPTKPWMLQVARNATSDSWGYLQNCRYALHDRDAKFCASFRETLRSAGIQPLALAAAESEPERNCGALGTLGEARMLVKADLLRRRLTQACVDGVRRALPRGEKPPRKR
jgi:hypothetical protein